jgi:2'-5' RNA ligase
MRLFAAIDLDDAARAAVSEVADRVRRRLHADAIRWVPSANLHVTLVFVGHVVDAVGQRVVTALEPPIAIQPFALTLTSAGAFPDRGAPRVIWCGVADATGRLAAVHREVERRLVAAAGIEPESRPYHPHITLARCREGARPVDRRALMRHGPDASCEWRVEHVTLYESRSSPRGSAYTAVIRSPLSDTIPSVS